MRLRSALTKTALVLPISVGLLFGPLLPMASTAHAGIFSDFYQGAKELSELPGEVNELKANYEMTLDKLSEAESTLESYREQNEALMEQNRELAASVTALTEAQQKREASARKTRVLILTGIALLAGYFLLLRVIRLLLRR